MYKCACMAENAFHSNREICALYARRTLEIFCSFVSTLNGAAYPSPPKYQTRTVGEYLCGINEPIFTWIVGQANFERIRSLNCTANSYIHAQSLRRDDSYPKLIENLYEVLLWLYKDQLKPETAAKSGGYSPAKVPKSGSMMFFGDDADFAPTPERTLKQLKKAFPKCNIEGICSVQPEGDHYIVLDLHGNKIRELPAPEALEYSQEEVQLLRSRMNSVKHEFEQLQEERDQLICDKDTRILSLKKQLEEAERNSLELTANQKRENETLRGKLQYLENSRQELTNSYRKRLQVLGDRFDELDNKYQALLPVEEQQDSLREQINILIQERDNMAAAFSQKQEESLREIEEIQRRLAQSQDALQKAAGNGELVARWKRDAEENAEKLREAQKAADKQLRQYQRQTIQFLRQAGIQPNALPAAEAVVIRGAAQLQGALETADQTAQAGRYLQIANQGLTQVDQGLTLYGNDGTKLRAFLWQVKCRYEDEINKLKQQLEEQRRKLEEERRLNAALYERYARSVSWANALPPSQKSGRKLAGRLAIAACLLLGLSGFTALNQWRLGNAMDSILTQEGAEDLGNQEEKDRALQNAPLIEENKTPEQPESPKEQKPEETNPPENPDGQTEDSLQPPDDGAEAPVVLPDNDGTQPAQPPGGDESEP